LSKRPFATATFYLLIDGGNGIIAAKPARKMRKKQTGKMTGKGITNVYLTLRPERTNIPANCEGSRKRP
jgi:hypothetical protein